MAMPLVQPFPGQAGRIETMARGLNFASAGARVLRPSDSDQVLVAPVPNDMISNTSCKFSLK